MYMYVVKTQVALNLKTERKDKTLKLLLDRTPYKNTGMNLCLFVMLKAF